MSVVAVGEGRTVGVGVEDGTGVARGEVWVVGVAVDTGKGVAVGSTTVFVGWGVDGWQPTPHRLRARARVSRMKGRNLYRMGLS
jgi:hypothetical protein